MEVYFYCSYERSLNGFFHTRLQNGALRPVEGGHEGLPAALGAFFSYDRFSILWRELGRPVEKPWRKPVVYAGMFGVREITGRFADGRNGVINLAFYAEPEEISSLRRIALTVLGDYPAFCSRILSWMQIGGPCGYQLNADAFSEWMRRCAENDKLRLHVPAESPALKRLPCIQRQENRIERDLLKFAVCTGNWKEIAESFGNRINWHIQPRCVATPGIFQKEFIDCAPLWDLLPEA